MRVRGGLGEFCDAVGSGEALSEQLPYQGSDEEVFDRGAVLAQMMLVAAGGGEARSGMEALRAEPEVFTDAPSVSTVHRILRYMTAEQVKAAAAAMAKVRQKVWPMRGITPGIKDGLTSGHRRVCA